MQHINQHPRVIAARDKIRAQQKALGKAQDAFLEARAELERRQVTLDDLLVAVELGEATTQDVDDAREAVRVATETVARLEREVRPGAKAKAAAILKEREAEAVEKARAELQVQYRTEQARLVRELKAAIEAVYEANEALRAHEYEAERQKMSLGGLAFAKGDFLLPSTYQQWQERIKLHGHLNLNGEDT